MADYRFESEHDIDRILHILNAAGPWTWQFRDSDSEGFYLSATNVEGKTKLRIVEDPPGYVLEITMYSNDTAAHPHETLHKLILENVLPSIGARNVRAK